jgi:hypothetical protein
MKKCSKYLDIRKMQIKTSLKLYLPWNSFRMAIIKKTRTNIIKNVREKELFFPFFLVVLGFELRASCLLGHSTSEKELLLTLVQM